MLTIHVPTEAERRQENITHPVSYVGHDCDKRPDDDDSPSVCWDPDNGSVWKLCVYDGDGKAAAAVAITNCPYCGETLPTILLEWLPA